MPLASGHKLGPYEIVSPLGAGGMGEVYRARDTRLERAVAIKILPAQVSNDPVRKQRFEREAKTISSLNHPHICVLHDIGSQDGVDYLVMECVEGETLTKPAPAGLVSGATLTAVAPTTPVTQEGTIVGTFQYMSPEQVEGKEVDGRSDVFSLGAVLYEMVTGTRAFEGKSQLSVASAILEKEPAPISTVKPMTPPALEHAVKRCLAKPPDERWQSASDLASVLKWITESGSPAGQSGGAELRRMKGERIAWLAAILLLLAALFTVYYKRPAAPNRPTWSYILPSERTAFSNFSGPAVVSPDGQKLAFVARTAEGMDLLWVRSLDAPSAQSIAGTEGAFYPFWSRDNQFLGFFAGGKLKTVSAAGGAVLTLCDATGPRGATWGDESTILFSLTWGGIQSVSASGGLPVAVTKLDASRSETSHRWPYFLPDGRHFFYLAANFTGGPAEAASVYVASLDLKENILLFHARSNVAYTSGYLLFVQQGTLMARPFDET